MQCEQSQQCSPCLWAYLCEPTPALGPQRLLEQKRIVDAIASATRRHIERYVVDSGGAIIAGGTSARLIASIMEARALERRVTLVVASAACLGTTLATRRRVLADLLAAGIIIEDPSGSLHPSASTVALAKAAATGRAMRRLPRMTRGDVHV